jgi:hypothetical protein
MKNEFHRHCLLQKGNVKTTAWIPEKFAKLDKYISLKYDEDDWNDGWKVIYVGTRLGTKYMLERSQDYKQTRKASDV